jgi:predicted nucleotidyltransferase
MMPRARSGHKRTAEGFVEILKNMLGDDLVSVVLFGSVAKGEAKSDSDIDLLIVAENLPRSMLARADIVIEAEKKLFDAMGKDLAPSERPMIAAIMRTPEEASSPVPLYLDMVDEAILLFDRDGFFAGVLSKLRDRLRTLGAKRLVLGNVRYWDLKPDYRPGDVVELG